MTVPPPPDAIELDDPSILDARIDNSIADMIMATLSGIPGGQAAAAGLSQVNRPETMFLNSRGWLISNQRTLLSELYVENGIVQTLVDIPVEDAFRGGIEPKTKQLSISEIADLIVALNRDGVLEGVAQATKWKRLFGGGGCVLVTDQKPDQPLDLNALTPDRPLEFMAADMWELYHGLSQEMLSDQSRIIPAKLRMNQQFYDFYGKKIDRTRVIPMKGKEPPSFLRQRLFGWGFSCVEPIVAAINSFMKTSNLVFEVLDEFKIDIYRIAGYNNATMTQGGIDRIQKRVALGNMQKNYQNALLMDVTDEHAQKQLQFTGLGDVKKELRIDLASALRMPMTKLYGISASGFNSGEDDIENYNAMVESDVRTKIKPALTLAVKLKCQQMYGFQPDDLEIAFKPLRMMSEKDEEDIKDKRFTRIATAEEKGLASPRETMQAINQQNLLGVQVAEADDLKKDLADDGLNVDPDSEGDDDEDEDFADDY